MARAGALLTHLIPLPPTDEPGESAFADEVRSGGDEGRLNVGRDLTRVELG